jgi:hypothetical protein
MSERLYTKNGRPLQVHGDKVHSRSGRYVGKLRNGKLFDPRGRYLGTVVGDRVVYRSTNSASISGPSVAANRAGIATARRAGSAIWGDEPQIHD